MLLCRTSRRSFIKQTGGAVTGLALTGCAGVAIHAKTWRNGRIDVYLSDHPALAEAGGRILVGAEGLEGPVLLLNNGDSFAAVFAVCTHLQCTLRPSGDFLRCPCHGSTYTLSGEVQRGPAERSLVCFKTSRSGDTVSILIDQES